MPLTARIGDDIRYGYAVGRVRVLEGRLLGRSTFERLLDASDLREQKRVLAETHVGRYLESAQTAEDVERGLEASLGDLYEEFLTRAGLPHAVVRYFQLPHDYANLRLALKARVVGAALPAQLSALGAVPPEAFSADSGLLPDEFRALLTMWDGAEEPPPLEVVDAAVDRALYSALTAAAKQSRLPFLRDLTRLRIDIANARVLIRARAKGLTPGETQSRLLPDGSPALEALAASASRLSAMELAEAIADTRALGHVPEQDLTDIDRFDLLGDLLIGRRMQAARIAPGGADPVLAYVLGREAEVLVLRTVVAGRLAGLDAETIRERLRERLS